MLKEKIKEIKKGKKNIFPNQKLSDYVIQNKLYYTFTEIPCQPLINTSQFLCQYPFTIFISSSHMTFSLSPP